MKSNKKIAIVISSFCGYLKEELEKNPGMFITPLQIFIDDQQWFEGFYDEKEKSSKYQFDNIDMIAIEIFEILNA